jgi:hypothetical protein
VTDHAEPLRHARRGELACRPSTRLGRPDPELDGKISFNSDQKSMINCRFTGMLPIELQMSHWCRKICVMFIFVQTLALL